MQHISAQAVQEVAQGLLVHNSWSAYAQRPYSTRSLEMSMTNRHPDGF
jgi:hypothetical protein